MPHKRAVLVANVNGHDPWTPMFRGSNIDPMLVPNIEEASRIMQNNSVDAIVVVGDPPEMDVLIKWRNAVPGVPMIFIRDSETLEPDLITRIGRVFVIGANTAKTRLPACLKIASVVSDIRN